jgi:hypothetical protein
MTVQELIAKAKEVLAVLRDPKAGVLAKARAVFVFFALVQDLIPADNRPLFMSAEQTAAGVTPEEIIASLETDAALAGADGGQLAGANGVVLQKLLALLIRFLPLILA